MSLALILPSKDGINPAACLETLARGHSLATPFPHLYAPLSRPATAGFRWADGTPFRVTVYTVDSWDLIAPEKRPDAYLDDTGEYYIAIGPDHSATRKPVTA